MVMAFALYPAVQQRARTELDAVTGRSRLPTFRDKQSLPYIEAIVWETLRWCLIAPLGVFRTPMQDDIYEGYLIPKGTLDIH